MTTSQTQKESAKGPVDRVVYVEPAPQKGFALGKDGKPLQRGIVLWRTEAEALNDLGAAQRAVIKEQNINYKALLDGDQEEYKKDREFSEPLRIRYNQIWLHAALRRVIVNHNVHSPFVKFSDTGVYKPGTILEMGMVQLYWGKVLRTDITGNVIHKGDA